MSGFVALISGGKDSLFSIMECVAHGYRLEAVVNLNPSFQDSCAVEIDSYMYQSVASDGVPLIASALNVPLYQFPITGRATCQDFYYSTSPTDEVEDLYRALSVVKSERPMVQYVCSGAILSDYQRIRVEHVAGRLSLRSLAFLWQRSTEQLLLDMLASSVDAMIVKIAAYGLRLDHHLGAHLSDVATELYELSKPPLCLNACGEGGEYETFTLDCPLFTQRICLQSKPRVIVHSDEDPVCPVAYLQLINLFLEDKDPKDILHDASDLLSLSCSIHSSVRRPFLSPSDRLQDMEFAFIRELLEDYNYTDVSNANGLSEHSVPRVVWNSTSPNNNGTAPLFSITCVGTSQLQGLPDGLTQATRRAMLDLHKRLASAHLTTNHVVHCLVVVNRPLSEELLTALDMEYSSTFGLPWEVTADGTARSLFPPSRVCVGVNEIIGPDGVTCDDLPSLTAVQLTAIVCPTRPNTQAPLSGGCRGLFVRSISHWAPASTGPYSQAVCVSSFPTTDCSGSSTSSQCTFFSGQVGLIPETLALPTCVEAGDDNRDIVPHTQCWLALRHCHRLLKVMSNAIWTNLFAAVCYGTSFRALDYAKHTFHTSVCTSWLQQITSQSQLPVNRNTNVCVCGTRILWVRVASLPHAACIEWQLVSRSDVTIYDTTTPIRYASISSVTSLSDACVLFCSDTVTTKLQPRNQCVIVVGGFLNRTDTLAGLFL